MNELHKTLGPLHLQQTRVTTFFGQKYSLFTRSNTICAYLLMTVPDCDKSCLHHCHRLFCNLPIQLSSKQNLRVVKHWLLVGGMECQDMPGYH